VFENSPFKMIRGLKNLAKKFYLKKRNYSTRLNGNLIESITSIYGKENVSLSESVRLHHAKDESLHK
jgi:hypothetical protein